MPRITERINDESFRLASQPHHNRYKSVPAQPCLGLQWHQKRPAFVKPKLKLSSYLDTATAQPPAAVSRPHPGFLWLMLRNDQLGDCVPAGKLHAVRDFHLAAGAAVPTFTDDDATLWYEKDGGFDPSNPSATDNGCDENVAVKNWQAGMPQTSDGVSHQIVGTVSVDPQNDTEVKIGVDEFVGVMDAVLLPVSTQGQTEWQVVGDPTKDPNSKPGSWGGHCVWTREFDPQTFGLVTWGEELLETVEYRHAYHVEAHVVITQEMLSKTGVGPSGVQWDDLVADMQKFIPAAQR